MTSESANVQFVDDGVFERNSGRHILAPVERATKKNATLDGPLLFRFLRSAPDVAAGNSRRGWIEQHAAGIEPVAVAGRAVDAPAVTKNRRQARNENVPVVAGAVLEAVELDFSDGVAGLDSVK